MIQTITINDIKEIERVGKKSWWAVETSHGKMSCWDQGITTQLGIAYASKQNVKVETDQKGEYINITKFIGMTKDAVEQQTKDYRPMTPGNADITVKPKDAFNNGSSKNTTMYTSYAKDVFIQLIGETKMIPVIEGDPSSKEGLTMIMDTAIALVKQAKGAFE